MKANLKTLLPLVTAAISCTLSLAAGATDNDSSDSDSHFSSNFTPIVKEVRKAVLNLSKDDLKNYGKILRTPCVTGPEFGGMGVHLMRLAMDSIRHEPRPGGGNILTLTRSRVAKAKEG